MPRIVGKVGSEFNQRASSRHTDVLADPGNPRPAPADQERGLGRGARSSPGDDHASMRVFSPGRSETGITRWRPPTRSG